VGKGADVNRVTVNGATPLNAAAFYGHVAVVNFLMEKGAE
jgi:ankyrin repeat protein